MKIYEQFVDVYPLFRESLKKDKEAAIKETAFVVDILKKSKRNIHTIIDLGGGVGMHAQILAKSGYGVTVLDRSKKALQLIRKKYSLIKTVKQSFETISLRKKYDAAICMWSTFPSIVSERWRKKFFRWIGTHVRELIILDEANFYRYETMKHGHEVYPEVSDGRCSLTIIQDWMIDKHHTRKALFTYTIRKKQSRATQTISENEILQFLTIEQLKKYLGKKWGKPSLLGDYNIGPPFDRKTSPRAIAIFQRRNK